MDSTGSSNPRRGGSVDTVTVVAYPSGLFSTLPQSHTLLETQEASSTIPTSKSPQPSNPTSSGISPPSSSSTTAFSSSPPTSTANTPTSSTSPLGSSVPTGPSSFTPLVHSPPQTNTSPSATASNLASEPPVYVGIALASIAAIGILAALVAWCIRRWYKHRRQRKATVLPWTHQDGDDFSGLEAGSRKYSTDWNADSASFSPTNQARFSTTRQCLTGDRDVGEPRRSDSYGAAHNDQRLPPPHLPSDGVGSRTQNGGDHSGNFRKPTIRHLPSHLVDANLSALALARYPDPMASEPEVGTPREDVVVPRYLSLKGNGLELPWPNVNTTLTAKETPPPPRSMAERLRRVSRPAMESWARAPSDYSGEPSLGAHREKPEGWAGSITSNLVSVFNAVAANIATRKADDEESVDTHRPGPPGRGTSRTCSHSDSPSGLPAATGRSKNPYLTRTDGVSTESSEPWTLEELADGTGVVHLNISPSKERSTARQPSSLYSSESSSTIPLVASHIPPPALRKSEVSHHFRVKPDRSSSRRSDRLALETAPRGGKYTSPPSGRLEAPSSRRYDDNTNASPTKRGRQSGSLVSRLSSTSSATSWNSGSSGLVPASSQLAEALRARKRSPRT